MDRKKRTFNRVSMMENKYGKTSVLELATKQKGGKTVLSDVSFTAPFKIMNPFPTPKGLQVMMLSASAGIMAGDTQVLTFRIGANTGLELTAQSYEKIHKMNRGCARRKVQITLEAGASFYYHPLPAIPFGGSAFESYIEIELEDHTADLIVLDILSCGRSARKERFAYRYYHSLTEIKRAGQWVYRDNTQFYPQQADMEGLGMYEGFTHLANMFVTGNSGRDGYWVEKAREVIEGTSQIEGGITELESGDYAVRLLGNSGQRLLETAEGIRGEGRRT